MRLALLSDTHGRHAALDVPPVDVVLHAGDFCRRGTAQETLDFLDWFATLKGEKVLVGGNHDRYAEARPEEMARHCARRRIHWLLDEERQVAGLRVYGSPWTPRFRSMAWNLDRGEPLERVWATLPGELDVLLTHGPPHGVCDRVFFGAHVGCGALRAAVLRTRPRLHVFGHIHEAHGEGRLPGAPTRFLNVATCRLAMVVRAPVLVNL